jgi:mRNA interferase RelE/StbE
MAKYKLSFKSSVTKDLWKIPKKDIHRILNRIEALADDPNPPGAELLTGDHRYRIRQGNYRILYTIEENELTVCIVKIGHRKEVYRN